MTDAPQRPPPRVLPFTGPPMHRKGTVSVPFARHLKPAPAHITRRASSLTAIARSGHDRPSPLPLPHAQTTRSFPAAAAQLANRDRTPDLAGAHGFHVDPLRPLRAELGAQTQERPDSQALPSGRQSDPARHIGLQQVHCETQDAAQDGDLAAAAADSELPGIHGYYAGLMAAARSSLSPAEAAAMIRRLRTEKILAVRAAKERRCTARANQRKPSKPTAAPPAILPKRQLG